MLFLFANSCHDEVVQESDLTLKSGKFKKDVVAEMKSWFDSNPGVNKFVLLDYADEIKWASAQVMEIDNSIVTEVSVKLKGKYTLMSEKDPSLNFDQRLLFIQKDGVITSYMEYLISKKDLSYLQDFEKVSYLNRDGSFAGSIVLENSKGELSQIYHSTGDCQEYRLKNAEETCYVLVEYFSDGSYLVIANWGCNGGGGGSTPSQTPTTPTSPSGSGGGGATSDPAPVPVVDASGLQNNAKAWCIYNKLNNSGLFTQAMNRFNAPSQPEDAFLGELNLSWKLAESENYYGYTVPLGVSNNNSLYSVEIYLNESQLNANSSTLSALTMLHEVMHAKLTAEFYTRYQTTNFNDLLSYYSFNMAFKDIDTGQEKIMFDNYADKIAQALSEFDQKNGISNGYNTYLDAVKYDLGRQLGGAYSFPSGLDAYNKLKNSTITCN